MYAILTHPQVDNETRVVCCSVLKWLVYEKNFFGRAMEVFSGLMEFYLARAPGEDCEPNKAQRIAEIVLKALPSSFMNNKEMYTLVQKLIAEMNQNMERALRIINILSLVLEDVEGETLNN